MKAVDAGVRALVDDMFETMYKAPGVGLAAIQLGIAKRVITVDTAKKDEPKEPQVFINPELISKSGDKNTHEEGCLSIPEYYEEVARPAAVRFRYLDLDGNILITNDPYLGVTAEKGVLSFAAAPENFGLRVTAKA